MDIALKKTLKLGFGRRPQFFLNISSSLVRIKLHTKNQPPNLLNYGDGYEEDLKIWIWKTILKYFHFFYWIFLLDMLKASCIPKISFLGALEVGLFGGAVIVVILYKLGLCLCQTQFKLPLHLAK